MGYCKVLEKIRAKSSAKFPTGLNPLLTSPTAKHGLSPPCALSPGAALSIVAVYLGLLFLVIVGYTVAGLYYFGFVIPQFNTFGNALVSTLFIGLGDWSLYGPLTSVLADGRPRAPAVPVLVGVVSAIKNYFENNTIKMFFRRKKVRVKFVLE